MRFESCAIRLHQASVAVRHHDCIRPILHHIDLEIGKGEWLAFVGSNGSGKSTLAKVLAGLCPLFGGSIEFGFDDLARTQLVMQNPEAQIVGETVYEDISFGLENGLTHIEDIPTRVNHALELVGLQSMESRPTVELSGGQKQLLGIAAALAADAPMIVFDEATAMLDPFARERILQIATKLHEEGKTVVWITQMMDELTWADRVVALDNGQIVFNGSNRQFFYDCADMHSPTPCERLGYTPPYSVQVAHRLLRRGCALPELPLTPTQLSKAVNELCRSV